MVKYCLTYENAIDMAEWFQSKPFYDPAKNVRIYCNSRIIKLTKYLNANVLKKTIPIEIYLFYPRVEVKPNQITFGHVLLGKSKSMLLSIYNTIGFSLITI